MQKQRKNAARESLLFLLLVIGVLGLLNVLSVYVPVGRIDLTKNRLFSLADGSKRIAHQLNDRMEITAYFTKDLPPPFNATEQQVRDLLGAYKAASKGKLFVRFVNPDDEQEQKEAREDGVQPVAHQNIENDKVSVVEGYRGLVIKYLGQKKTLPVIEDTAGLEYAITTAMKELAGEKRLLGVVKHGESPSLERGLTKLRSVLPTYELRHVDLNIEVPTELSAILVVEPTTSFSDVELGHINQFVMKGGSLGVFGGALRTSIANGPPAADAMDSELNKILKPWGVTMQSKMIADAHCGRAPMRSAFGMQVLVPYPPIPVIQASAEQQKHPVMFQLASPMIPFTAALQIGSAPKGAAVQVLAQSSEQSWILKGPPIDLAPKEPREWEATDERGPFPMIAAIEGVLPSAFEPTLESTPESEIEAPPSSQKPVRILVVGTGSFLRDEFLPEARQGADAPANAATALALNAIDWLAAEQDLVAIRAKTIEDPALNVPEAVLAAETAVKDAQKALSNATVQQALEKHKTAVASWDKKKALYRWGNTLGIPLLFALYGVFRWRRRVSRRKNLNHA